MDHPGDFNNKVGYDVYLNPWWGLNTVTGPAMFVVSQMNTNWGKPDLWFQGCFHELLWGPRDLPRGWRPSFHVNVSGTNGITWRNFWLPWRGVLRRNVNPYPYDCVVNDEFVDGVGDTAMAIRYARVIPKIQQALASRSLLYGAMKDVLYELERRDRNGPF